MRGGRGMKTSLDNFVGGMATATFVFGFFEVLSSNVKNGVFLIISAIALLLLSATINSVRSMQKTDSIKEARA